MQPVTRPGHKQTPPRATASDPGLRIALTGDVMTGRGVDQILPRAGSPVIHERWIRDARDYVGLAARVHGAPPAPVDWDYIWGEALADWHAFDPALRLINLETSITARGAPWPGKGIQYRMHPDNAPCLAAARIDCCTLANNHVLDWGYAGLADTLTALQDCGIRACGAGVDGDHARRPAAVALPWGATLRIHAYGAVTSGIPAEWAALPTRAGVNLLPDFSGHTLERVAADIDSAREPGDRVIVSVHWGGNWGYRVPAEERDFAKGLIDAGVDLVHGHSSHHFKGFEIYRGRLILYGCGDFITDYEGIEGHEVYRPDLSLNYCVTLDPSDGRLEQLEIVPYRLRRMMLSRARASDVRWVMDTLQHESTGPGSDRLRLTGDRLSWSAPDTRE